jgi:hypothetical protein
MRLGYRAFAKAQLKCGKNGAVMWRQTMKQRSILEPAGFVKEIRDQAEAARVDARARDLGERVIGPAGICAVGPRRRCLD